MQCRIQIDFWCKLSSPSVVAEPWERCFELFRMQNSQHFLGLRFEAPLGRAYSDPRLPSCTTVFLLATLVKKPVHPKHYWIRHYFVCCLILAVWAVSSTVFSPINGHSKRRTPLIRGQFFFHRLNSGQSLIKNFLKGEQVISGHFN